MTKDIRKSIPGNPIKNGTIIVSTKPTGSKESDNLNTYVSNQPEIGDIEFKYDNRFDDPSYYGGISGTVIGP